MRVTLADPLVTVDGWPSRLDSIGSYQLKIRKTPEEMKEERRMFKQQYGETSVTINPVRKENRSVITHDSDNPSTVYFLPGFWPCVKERLELNNSL